MTPPSQPYRLRCCNCKHNGNWLHMQVSTGTDPAHLLEQLTADALPDGRGLETWRSFLRAHATLMRQLGTESSVSPLANRRSLSI
jgi:hypothetical protein